LFCRTGPAQACQRVTGVAQPSPAPCEGEVSVNPGITRNNRSRASLGVEAHPGHTLAVGSQQEQVGRKDLGRRLRSTLVLSRVCLQPQFSPGWTGIDAIHPDWDMLVLRGEDLR